MSRTNIARQVALCAAVEFLAPFCSAEPQKLAEFEQEVLALARQFFVFLSEEKT